MSDSRPQFDELLHLCSDLLKGESLQFLRLIEKRYAACSEQFRNSPEMGTLLQTTCTKLREDKKRTFVHLKDFVTELKAWAANSDPCDRLSRKRKAGDPLQSVMKAARVEDSMSDSSDMEGKLQRALGDNKDSACKSRGEVGKKEADSCDQKSHSSPHSNNSGPAEAPSSEIKHSTSSIAVKSMACENELESEDAKQAATHLHIAADCTKLCAATDTSPSPHSTDGAEIPEPGKGVQNRLKLKKDVSKCPKLNNVVDKLKSRCSSQFTSLPSTSSALVDDRVQLGIDGEDNADAMADVQDFSGNAHASNSDIRVIELDYRDVSLPTSLALDGEADERKAKNMSVQMNGGQETNLQTDMKSEKHLKHIRRLEKLLEKIRDKIEEVRDKELSLEDMEAEDSTYVLEDKLQKKFVKVWNKLCEVKGRTTSSGRPVERRFQYEGVRYPEINRKIERFVNRRKLFPDFHDIKGIVQKVNRRSKLGLSAELVNNISQEAFLDVGESLQKRRHEDFIDTFYSKQTANFRSDQDPALFDAELRQKLDKNRQLGKSRLEEVISKYSHLQAQGGDEDEEGGRDPADSEESHDSKDEDRMAESSRSQDCTMSRSSKKTAAAEPKLGRGEEDEEEELEDGYSCSIEMDVDEGWQEMEGEALDGDGVESSSRKTLASHFPSRSLAVDAASRGAGKQGKDGIFATSGKSTQPYLDVAEPLPASGGQSQLTKTDLTSNSSSEFEGAKPFENKICATSSKAVSSSLLRTDGLKNIASCSGSDYDSLMLKHPFLTKTNSKSPVQVPTRPLRLPQSLIKRNKTNGERGCRRSNLFYPGKSSSRVCVERDSSGCMVIASSDEDDDRLKVRVKKENDGGQEAGMNGACVGTVKKGAETFDSEDNDDVIVLSD